MTTEQIWIAIVVASVYVVTLIIRLVGDTINDLMRARNKKVTARIEGETVDVQSRTETEKMGIQYMQSLVRENTELREENKANSILIATQGEKIRIREETLQEVNKTREEQLAVQSELKIEAIRKASEMEQKALRAESQLVIVQGALTECTTQSNKCSQDLSVLLGKYTELHSLDSERRNEWHDERNNWQMLDSARQTEVQRARFVMRHLDSSLNEDQRIGIQRACAAKGFDYDQYVEVAGSLEMYELEDLRKKNAELKAKLEEAIPQSPALA